MYYFTSREGIILLCYQRLSAVEPRFLLSFCSVDCSWLHPKTGPTRGPKIDVAVPGIPPRNHPIQKKKEPMMSLFYLFEVITPKPSLPLHWPESITKQGGCRHHYCLRPVPGFVTRSGVTPPQTGAATEETGESRCCRQPGMSAMHH